jgi:hypothetical protein
MVAQLFPHSTATGCRRRGTSKSCDASVCPGPLEHATLRTTSGFTVAGTHEISASSPVGELCGCGDPIDALLPVPMSLAGVTVTVKP